MELSSVQISHLMKRFPEFELSYETISHKNVQSIYDSCLAIPTGKKSYAWFTFHKDEDVCYLFDLNKEKKISRATIGSVQFEPKLSLGTVVYGTIIIDESTGYQYFLVEDIYYYKGISLVKSKFGEKLLFFGEFMKSTVNTFRSTKDIVFMLPFMWATATIKNNMNNAINHGINNITEYSTTIPEQFNGKIPYPIHHIQYRSSSQITPYLNILLNRKLNTTSTNIISKNTNISNEPKKQSSHLFETIKLIPDFNKTQYKYPTVFQVTADIQFDIYHLFAYGKNKKPVYYNLAYIPNYKSSVFLNGLFRNIRENKNLDYIEESDDEDDFQNTSEDKYVNVDKVLLMECVFHTKFKRWIPLRVVDKYSKVVHMSQLVRDYY